MKIRKLFDARHGVKKRCQTWHRINQWLDNPMPCLASFFDAMSGVKKACVFSCWERTFVLDSTYACVASKTMNKLTARLWENVFIRSLVCISLASDCVYVVCQLFDAKNGVKNDARHGIDFFRARITRCHVWHRFFDAMSGVKKLAKCHAAINCTTLANKPST